MRRYTLMIGAALAAITAAGTAQAYEWGGGSCIGYDCARRIHDGRYYRPARGYHDDYDVRPRVRVYERRIYRSHPSDDWDDDDED